MADSTPSDLISKRVVVTLPGQDRIQVRTLPYRQGSGTELSLDVYLPESTAHPPGHPAVLFVTGYPDPGFAAMMGSKLKDMGSYVSWAQLVAASGMVAIAYENEDPVADASAVLDFVRDQGGSIGVDTRRIGVWSASGNVPNALALLMRPENRDIRCATLCYGYTLDVAGQTAVADTAAQFGFANPAAGRSVDDLPPTLALLLARAGRDEFPGLNASMDRFVADALAANLPLTVMNHPEGPHAFDLEHPGETTRAIVEGILAFLRHRLLAQ